MKRVFIACLSILVLLDAVALADDLRLRLPGHNNPPPARPKRRSGGEGFPPLPLPVTPLRRTEKKREPTPPVLIAKIEYASDLYNITSDVRNLLKWIGKQSGIHYSPKTIPLKRFSFDPIQIPVMYLSGHDPIPDIEDNTIRLIREYVYSGGTILANACCGDRRFTESFRRFIRKVFPEKGLYKLGYGHPIFHCWYNIEEIRFQKGTGEEFTAEPLLEGVDIGCRTAIIFSAADLANGWYGQDPPMAFKEGFWVRGYDARRLGANIVTYILANLIYARTFPLLQEEYKSAIKGIEESFRFAQIVHGGDWDPNPSAIYRLQKYLSENTTLNFEFGRVNVRLDDPDIFEYPFVYMLGHRAFSFSSAEIATLRKYLLEGGVLFAEACCGRSEFDIAFRREIKRVLPEYSLRPLDSDHPIYSINYKIENVNLTPFAQDLLSDKRPLLEAITIDDRIAVIYSPLSISNGWEGIEHPFSLGYMSADSIRLGINIILYIMTH